MGDVSRQRLELWDLVLGVGKSEGLEIPQRVQIADREMQQRAVGMSGSSPNVA